jgi:hypothetical protein
MLRRLRDAWKNYLTSIPKSEVVDSIPEEQWDRPDLLPKVSKAKRAAFEELLQLAFSHLPPEHAKQLALDRSAFLERADEVDSALERALTEFESVEARKARCAAIACDWKATEELDWQVASLAVAHGIQDRWASPRAGLELDLKQLAVWLAEHNLTLFDFSAGDNLLAFAVCSQASPRVKQLFQKLRVPVRARSEAP